MAQNTADEPADQAIQRPKTLEVSGPAALEPFFLVSPPRTIGAGAGQQFTVSFSVPIKTIRARAEIPEDVEVSHYICVLGLDQGALRAGLSLHHEDLYCHELIEFRPSGKVLAVRPCVPPLQEDGADAQDDDRLYYHFHNIAIKVDQVAAAEWETRSREIALLFEVHAYGPGCQKEDGKTPRGSDETPKLLGYMFVPEVCVTYDPDKEDTEALTEYQRQLDAAGGLRNAIHIESERVRRRYAVQGEKERLEQSDATTNKSIWARIRDRVRR
ncbi:hypothetical protein SCAR479_00993 [Seiridium cardinale]|uniref:Uncharacterized protein n=1 Tax=Seiridium cardinale TaxID=138064 RepID=A0ABR2Y867_9PEZI